MSAVAAALLLLAFCETAAAQAKRPAALRSVTINSEPGAKVWINGVLYGTTSSSGSLKINTVAPGRKTVRVRADGFKQAEKILPPTQSGTLSVPLAKTTDPAELAFQNAERLSSIDRQKAFAAYRQAIKLRPGYLDAYIGLARVQLDAGEYEAANKTIADARRTSPGVAEVSAIEGRIFKNFAEENKAIAAFKRAIREGKGFQPEAYAGLGLLFQEKAQNAAAAGEYGKEKAFYAEAAKYLASAIDQLSGAPDAVVIYQLLGLVYEEQKEFAKAIEVYQQFLDYFPEHDEAEMFRSFIVQLKKQLAQQK